MRVLEGTKEVVRHATATCDAFVKKAQGLGNLQVVAGGGVGELSPGDINAIASKIFELETARDVRQQNLSFYLGEWEGVPGEDPRLFEGERSGRMYQVFVTPTVDSGRRKFYAVECAVTCLPSSETNYISESDEEKVGSKYAELKRQAMDSASAARQIDMTAERVQISSERINAIALTYLIQKGLRPITLEVPLTPMEVRESRGAPRRVNGKFDDKLGLKVALEYMDPRSNLAGQTPPVSVLRGNLMSGLDRYRTSQDSKFSEELDGLDREFTNYERSHAKAVQVVSNQQQLKTVLLGRFQMLSERMTEVQNQQNEIQSLREAIETKAQEFQREVEGLKSSNASDVYQLERRLASKAQEIEELSISYLARLDGQDADMDQLRAQIQRLEGEIFNKDAQLQESARQLQIQMGNLQQQVVQSRRSNFLGFGLGFALGFALGKTVSGAQSPGL